MNKIILTKTISAFFLAIVLVTGTITALSSTLSMTNAEAQLYPNGIDYNNYQKYKDSNNKSISLNKIKCINTNLNINGNNTADINVGNKGQGYSGAYSSGVNGEGYNGYYEHNNKQGKGFDDCVINNNNNNTNVVGGGNVTDGGGNATDGDGTDTVRTTLSVSKIIGECTPDTSQDAIDACEEIETRILPNLFILSVIDNTQIATLVEGSSVPVVVTLNPGGYQVLEVTTPSLFTVLDDIINTFSVDITSDVTATGNCTPLPGGGAGTIAEGESETCNIVNSYEVTEMI